jgi:hypothetical protein
MIEVEVGDTIVEFPDGTAPDVMRGALQKRFGAPQQETPVGKSNSSMQQIIGGMENLLPSAEQGTNPNPEAYKGRYLGPATIGEADEVFYKDANGVPVPTDSSKHVVIRDPRDGEVKVFARSADTDEGGLVGASRVLAPGLATGPLARTPGAARAIAPVEAGSRAEIVGAAGRQGIEIPRAIASDSYLTQQTGAGLRNVPILGTPIVKNTDKAIKQMGAKVEDIASAQGGRTAEQAGDIAGRGLQDWIGPKSKKMVSDAYDAVDAAIDPNARGALDEAMAEASKILSKRQNASLGDSKAVNLIHEAMMRPEGMNYRGIKDLRTSIGEHLDNGMLPADISKTELSQIYGGLTRDLGAVVEKSGGTTGRALWQKANDTAAEIAKKREELVKIIGSDGNASGGTMFTRIKAAASGGSKADTDLLVKTKAAIGADDWERVVSGVTAKLGVNNQGIFQPGRFLSDWGKLSEAGKSALYGTGAHKAALDDIAKISMRWPQLQKFQNPSGTAQSITGATLGASVVMHPLAALATVLEPTTAAGIGAAALLARALAKPATAASAAAWARSYERAARSANPGAFSQLALQSRNLANTLNSQLGTTLTPGDFLKAIQGSNPARSDEK